MFINISDSTNTLAGLDNFRPVEKKRFSRLSSVLEQKFITIWRLMGIATESSVQHFESAILMLHFQSRWRSSRSNSLESKLE